MSPETKLQRRIMLALSANGCTVFRNETGRFWTGKPIHKASRQVTLDNAAMIPVGLCVGSSDIIGIHHGSGRFLAVEVKTQRGRVSKEQLAFIDAINKAGGIAGIARSPADALALLPTTDNREEDTQ